jgi:hypothetical protein
VEKLASLGILGGWMSDDPRLGTIQVKPDTTERVSVINFPFDEGCTRNGKRLEHAIRLTGVA